MGGRRGRLCGVILAVVVAIAPVGCRTLGRIASDGYSWSSATFTPNPTATVSYHAGLVVGFIAALPLCLISWPLATWLYPEEEKEFYLSAILFPSLLTGTVVGSIVGAVFYPFGWPFVPDEPEPPPGPVE